MEVTSKFYTIAVHPGAHGTARRPRRLRVQATLRSSSIAGTMAARATWTSACSVRATAAMTTLSIGYSSARVAPRELYDSSGAAWSGSCVEDRQQQGRKANETK